jgi:hypothetical protein
VEEFWEWKRGSEVLRWDDSRVNSQLPRGLTRPQTPFITSNPQEALYDSRFMTPECSELPVPERSYMTPECSERYMTPDRSYMTSDPRSAI